MLLPEAIRHARKELGLSQQKLADLAGIERKQLSTLEGGGNVTLATLRKVLARLPNLSTFELDVGSAPIVNVVPAAAPRPVNTNAAVVSLLTEAVRMLSEDVPETPAMPEEAHATFNRGVSRAFALMAALAARRKQRR